MQWSDWTGHWTLDWTTLQLADDLLTVTSQVEKRIVLGRTEDQKAPMYSDTLRYRQAVQKYTIRNIFRREREPKEKYVRTYVRTNTGICSRKWLGDAYFLGISWVLTCMISCTSMDPLSTCQFCTSVAEGSRRCVDRSVLDEILSGLAIGWQNTNS